MKRSVVSVAAITISTLIGSVGLIAPVSVGPVSAGSHSTATDTVLDEDVLVDALIVERLPGRTTSAARADIEATTTLDTTVGTKLGGRFETIEFDAPISAVNALDLAASLEADGLVVSAEPDYPRHSATNDTNWNSQWSLQPYTSSNAGISLEAAWAASPGTHDVVVAVIDTGRPMFNGADHPDMVGNLVDGRDFMSLSDPYNPRDGNGWDDDETDEGDWETTGQCDLGSVAQNSSWHGSHVAGTIAAESNNNLGIAGINPRAKVQHIRVLGTCGGSTSDEAAAIRWAAGLAVAGVPINPTPADVINLSLGGPGPCTSAEQQAIDAATKAGSIVVVAAGNDNLDLDVRSYSPASCTSVITVAAVETNGSRLFLNNSTASNYGSKVEIAAPGRSVISTMNAGSTTSTSTWNYLYKTGTSMATPTVAGVVSLMLSHDNTLNLTQVVNLLQQTASPFPAGSTCSSNIAAVNYCGPGIVNAGAALQALTGFVPVNTLEVSSPRRVLDTRDGTGGVPIARIGNTTGTATDLAFTITGKGDIPTTGVAAVSLNVTATQTTATDVGGYVTVYPCTTGRPNVSNLNFVNGQTTPNAVIVPVDTNGQICLHVYGTAHLIIDVNGWYPIGSGFTTVTPDRVMDTRDGTGGVPIARVDNTNGTAPDLAFTITGKGGVPATGVDAVSLNVTATQTTAPDVGGYVTVYPCATGRPNVSNLNFTNGQTTPNTVIVPVDTTGQICLHVYGTAHLIIDVNGWYPIGSGFTTVTPDRVMDTRDGTGGVPIARVDNTNGTTPDLAFTITGKAGIPTTGVDAVSLNVTATQTTAPDVGGYVTVYPCATGRPNVSNLNFTNGQTTPNTVIVPVDTTGQICLHVYGTAHLIIDINGWFQN